ncbi:putative dna mismatch repair protein msh-2 protein [Phaeoacremonium minimum UCRPA7]|uniref:Putative dna mismatch repair protein msh-2 protein n=1 Tax=Phaeoacremonium minimum (strain UCR-PA7) TaxID=1286976 RepID=R8BKS0_PHAM7|nr:putative dna mismatch repair protein msh-2 protein [Phaeoacremonium minimum UCRPA7]EON99906.1 putative dna mismatch repair protein msh-2 protein [Phaeoacremonium minimum UCRPA7]
MAPIKACESAIKASSMLAKGQRTLQELKNGIVIKKEEKETKAQAQVASTLNPDGSKMSLLDRIRYKQLQQSQEPSGPSREELERRAALQRVDDIAAVISMLCRATSMGQQRISFTMLTLLQKLKDSLRLPISREEGTACIRILAKEIAPEWMRVVTIGGKENVVVQVNFQPSKAVIQERVKAVAA